MLKRYIRYCLLLLLPVVILISCGEMDDTYDEFLKGGEKPYSGKPEALLAYSGRNRAKLTWDFVSDPKIIKAKIFWKNPELPSGTTPAPGERLPGRDSVELAIVRTNEVDHIEVFINNLKEGVFTFEVYSYDKNGNSSIKTEVIAEVFGETYQNSISNRPLNRVVYYKHNNNPTNSVVLEWFGVGQQVAVIDVKHTNTASVVQNVMLEKVVVDPRKPKVFLDKNELPEFKKGAPFEFRTGYLPNATAIDTFFTDYKTVASADTMLIKPGTYRIIAKNSGKSLKTRANSTSANAQIEQNAYDPASLTIASSKWKLIYNAANNAVFTNFNSNLNMNVASASTADAANIQQAAQNADLRDDWTIEAVVNTQFRYFRVRNKNSNKVIEIAGGVSTDGAAVQQRTMNATANHQQFEFIPVQ